jgi:hypothetical protein
MTASIKQLRAIVYAAQHHKVVLPRPFPQMNNGYDWGGLSPSEADVQEGRAELNGPEVSSKTLENWARFAAVRRHFPRLDAEVASRAIGARAAHTFAQHLRGAGVPIAGFETEAPAPTRTVPSASQKPSVEAGLFKLLMGGLATREEIEVYLKIAEALREV